MGHYSHQPLIGGILFLWLVIRKENKKLDHRPAFCNSNAQCFPFLLLRNILQPVHKKQ